MLARELAVVFFLFAGFIQCAKITHLPKEFKRCRKEDSACLRAAAEDAFVKIRKGYPSINVQPIEPLTIPEIRIGQARGPVSLNIIQKNVEIHGLTHDHRIWDFSYDFKTNKTTAGIYYPKVTLISDTVIDGKILVVPIRGKGKSKTVMDAHNCSLTANFTVVEKNGLHYIKIDEDQCDYHFDIKKMAFSLENLYGDKSLNEAINRVFNDNWKLVFSEMRPAYEIALAKILAHGFNRFYSKVPLEEIFLNYTK